MIEILKHIPKIDFVSKFSVTSLLSLVLVASSVIALFTKMKYGVDFSGGAEIQVKFDQTVAIDDLRTSLKRGGLFGVSVQTIGEEHENEYLVKVSAKEQNLNQLTERVNTLLKDNHSGFGVDIRKVDIVGPKAGAELRWRGFQAMLWAFIAIMVYIGLRFDFKYSPGAIVALFHDVSIVLGVYAIFQIEFTLQTVAALLAVIGYSVNDTVVVYDRVREFEQKYTGMPIKNHINDAINQTLARTFLTSTTTLFVSVIMWSFGGGAIRNFFTAITAGVLIGTYSSIFVAAPVTMMMDKFLNKKKK